LAVNYRASSVLGVDYGKVRTGLAVAKPGESPQRLGAIKGQPKEVAKAAEENGVDLIVVGWPRNLEGDETAQTAAVGTFVRHLSELTTARVELQDEALTSELALKRLKIEKVPAAKQKRELDAEAAVIILEDYLNRE
jgi:putative Holliday junction resolvase